MARISLLLLILLSAGPAAAQTLPSWTLAEELRVGAIDGPEAFSRISGMTVSRDGRRVYVAQPEAHAIRVLDATTGEMAFTVGRHGEGPGEFRYIDFLGWSGDALWATDFLLKRYSTFTAAGEHLETRSTARWVAEARGGVPIALTASGHVVLQTMLTSKMLADGTVTASPWYLGNPVDESVRPFAMRQLQGTTTLAPYGEWGVYFRQPLAERSLIALHPGGDFIVVVQQPAGSDPPGQFTITRYDPGGREVGRRAYDYRAFPVSARAADSLVRARAADFEHGMSPAQAYELARREVRVPTHYPPVAAVTVARDSSVWLQLSDVDPSTRKWLVLDGRGEIRAQVAGPTSFSVRVPGAETVWGLMLGNYDVPYVARFGVTR